MTMYKSYRTIAVLTTIGALTSSLSFAQNTDDNRRLDEIARNAARQFAAERVAEKEQTRPTTPPTTPGTVVELTLDAATQRALERNLDIAVERLNPQTYDFSLAALDANYKPTLTSNFSTRSQTAFSRSQTAGGDVLVTDTITSNYGISKNMRWGGGSFAAAFNNNRQAQSDLFATRNPALNTSLTASYVQPILRNFRIDGTRLQLQVTQINQQISETTLRATITRTLVNVRNAYWDLVYAIQAADVAERSLTLATRLVQDNQARVEVGTLAPLDVVQAQAEEATRRQTVTQTVAARRTAELTLKRLIVNGTDDPLWPATIEPIDRPTYLVEPHRCRRRGPEGPDDPDGPGDGPQTAPVQRPQSPESYRPATACARPDRHLRAGRDRRSSVRPTERTARRHGPRRHSQRLLGCPRIDRGSPRADLEHRREPELPDRHQPGRSEHSAGAAAPTPDDRAIAGAGAADCHRGDERGAAG